MDQIENRGASSTLDRNPYYWHEIILAAGANGFIGDLHLAGILAMDNQYKEILPKLWNIFKLNLRKEMPELSSPEQRELAWSHLITLWTTGTIAGAPSPNGIKLLPFRAGQPGQIELAELRDFLKKWNIPFPTALYKPSATENSNKRMTDVSAAAFERHKVIGAAIDAALKECRRLSVPEKEYAERVWKDKTVNDAIRSVYSLQKGDQINLDTVRKNLRRYGFPYPKGSGGGGNKLPKFIRKKGT